MLWLILIDDIIIVFPKNVSFHHFQLCPSEIHPTHISKMVTIAASFEILSLLINQWLYHHGTTVEFIPYISSAILVKFMPIRLPSTPHK